MKKSVFTIVLFAFLVAGSLAFINKEQVLNGLTELSDEFKDPRSIDDWKIFKEATTSHSRIEKVKIDSSGSGSLTLIPGTAGWYRNYHGAYVYKEIDGDFMVTTKVKVTGKKSPMPNSIWSIAGLLVRKPETLKNHLREMSKENWIYINTGRGEGDSFVFDTKSTKDGESEFFIEPAPQDWVYLRIVHIDSAFVTMYKTEKTDWKIFKRFVRKDLTNETLQVGMDGIADCMVAFSMSEKEFNNSVMDDRIGKPDVIATYEYVKFETPKVSSKIRSKISSTLNEVSDKELLSELALR